MESYFGGHIWGIILLLQEGKETINEKKFLKTEEEEKGKLKIESNVYYKKALQKMVPKPINSET